MRPQFKDESGVALVMAVWILAFLMLAGSSLVFYASSGTSHAERSTEDVRAVNLAEAGENYARAILHNAGDPTVSTAVGSGTLTLEGGTVNYSGTYDSVEQDLDAHRHRDAREPDRRLARSAGPSRARSTSSRLVGSADPAWGYNFSDAPDRMSPDCEQRDVHVAAVRSWKPLRLEQRPLHGCLAARRRNAYGRKQRIGGLRRDPDSQPSTSRWMHRRLAEPASVRVGAGRPGVRRGTASSRRTPGR